jgi:hypothetical protein
VHLPMELMVKSVGFLSQISLKSLPDEPEPRS